VVGGGRHGLADQVVGLLDRRVGMRDDRPGAVLHLAEDALELHAFGGADRHEHEIGEADVVLVAGPQGDGLAGAGAFLDVDVEILGRVVASLLRPIERQVIAGERPVQPEADGIGGRHG
jgi:hypothetical protein